MELHQKTFGDKRHFKLSDDRVYIKTSTFKENLEYSLKYDELGFDIFKKRDKNAQGAFYAFIAFDILYIYLLITSILDKDKPSMIAFWVAALLLFGLFTILSFQSRHKNLVYLTGGFKVLELMNDKPNESEVSNFIEQIHAKMKSYLKEKHIQIDTTMPKEYHISQFKWLKEIKAINHEEYEELIQELDTKYLLE